jgi:hypothetical protein
MHGRKSGRYRKGPSVPIRSAIRCPKESMATCAAPSIRLDLRHLRAHDARVGHGDGHARARLAVRLDRPESHVHALGVPARPAPRGKAELLRCRSRTDTGIDLDKMEQEPIHFELIDNTQLPTFLFMELRNRNISEKETVYEQALRRS